MSTAPLPTASPAGLPRLLAGLGAASGALGLAAHDRSWGTLPSWRRGALTAELTAAGLTGRGGAGFPTGRKIAAVAQAAARERVTPVLVANGMEGEPASHKDRVLLARAPHLVLDGVAAAGYEIGARRAVLAVKRGSPHLAALQAAAAERGGGRRGSRDAVRVEIVAAPSPYVSSQETALLRWLSGGPAKPVTSPPRPAERGVDGRPTLVSNVETFAHIGLIARFGASWFRAVGSTEAAGSRLVTLQGAVNTPGVHEVAGGATLAEVLAATGGAAPGAAAFLVGGYFGTWLPAAEAARVAGERGCGVVIALPPEACGVRETARLVGWLAGNSAGQCGPCRFGLPAMAGVLARLADRQAGPGELTTLRRWAAEIPGRGACNHPDGTAGLVASALRTFGEEVDAHLRGRCSATRRTPVCPLPEEAPRRWK